MADLLRTLRTAAWKLSVARVATAACVVVGIAAGSWIIIVLAGAARAWGFEVIAAATLACILVSAWRSRAGGLEAARRVEQLAGWQERLSTLVELEAAGSDNAFRKRLDAEVAALLKEHSPSALIPWGLMRPAVVAGVLIVAAAMVTAILPDGLFARGSENLSSDRRRAADAIEDAISRADRTPAEFSDLRAELVSLLDKVRSNAPVDEARSGVDRIINDVDRRASESVQADAKRAASELAKAQRLVPLAASLAKLDRTGIEQAAGDLAKQFPSMSDAERKGVASALDSAAGKSESPGVSDPLKSMAHATRARDANAMAKSASALASAVSVTPRDVASNLDSLGSVRRALVDARAALGGGEGGPARRDFFVESKRAMDNATGAGNLGVRTRPEDIASVWQGTKAVDTATPQLSDVIRDARAEAERGSVAPAYRDYVRRYFATDNP